MTLTVDFPSKEISFPILGKRNCRSDYFTRKFGDGNQSKIPITGAKILLFQSQYGNALLSYLSAPKIVLPFNCLLLAKYIYNAQDIKSVTAVTTIACEISLLGYLALSARNGSLGEFSQLFWDSSIRAKNFYEKANSGHFQFAKI